MAAPIGSMLLASSQADEMKAWYRRAFQVEENDGGAVEFGPDQPFIEPHSKVPGATAEPARCNINPDVSDCRASESQLRSIGATWVREVEQMPFGLIGKVADPNGDDIQIIERRADPEY